MSGKVPGLVADLMIGVLVAGVVVGALVPVLGAGMGPTGAIGVAVACVAGALVVGRLLRRSPRARGG